MFTPEYEQKVRNQPGFVGFNNLGAAQFTSGYGPGTYNQQTQTSTDGSQRGPSILPTTASLVPGTTSPMASRTMSGRSTPSGASRSAYDPVKMMEEGWKQQQANMQRVMQENRQREEMIRQRQQEERYKQMMGMDLNASLRPWNQTPTGNRFVASPNVFNPLGSASIAGFGLGPVAPSIGTLPTHYTALPPVNPIQMLGVPGRFGMPQSSGQPFHMQAGEFFGLGVR